MTEIGSPASGQSSVTVIIQLDGLGFARRSRLFAVLSPAPLLRLGDAVACVRAEYPLLCCVGAISISVVDMTTIASCQKLSYALQPCDFVSDRLDDLITIHCFSLPFRFAGKNPFLRLKYLTNPATSLPFKAIPTSFKSIPSIGGPEKSLQREKPYSTHLLGNRI
jgi:hypothetical protein